MITKLKMEAGQKVKFSGMLNPYFKPLEETIVVDKYANGIFYIEHPDGYTMDMYKEKVVLANEKQHIEKCN